MSTSSKLLIILGIVALLTTAACARKPPPGKAPPKPVPIVTPSNGAIGMEPTGLAAIAAPSPPALITEAQVRSYVSSHRFPGVLASSNANVQSVTQLNAQQVSAVLKTAPIAVASQVPMWLVVLTGQFLFSGPPGPTSTFPVAVEVFNARTGQLMQYGGMMRAPQPPSRMP